MYAYMYVCIYIWNTHTPEEVGDCEKTNEKNALKNTTHNVRLNKSMYAYMYAYMYMYVCMYFGTHTRHRRWEIARRPTKDSFSAMAFLV